MIRTPLLLLVSGLALSASIAAADPPARVGRLSYVTGVVSFSPAGDDQWAQAVRNRPVIAGDRVWSDRDGRVEIEFGSGAVRAGAATSIGIVNIDAGTAQFELLQGAIDLRVRRLARNEIVEIDTPNLAFQATQPGRYRIEVDAQGDATIVLVREGSADVFGERVSYVVDRGQGYRFFGTDLANPEFLRPHGIDALDRFAQERDARFARAVSSRYVSPAVVGYEDLDRYGTWRPAGDYGNVWFPRDVAADWAPYRNGHWSWIDPWGWTWVDDAPWGFAPFHYGRWAYVQERWGWVPGPVNVQPVYAPALVAFIGGATLAVAASSGPAVGWFPLAPREVYRPAYAVSRDYYRAVNVSNTVVNTTIINNTYVNNFASAPPPRDVSYANLRVANAITAVPRSALAESRPVNRAAVRLPARTIDVSAVTAAAQVAPSRTAFVGAASEARARPPERTRDQAVVAKTAPPPPPVPIAQKLPLLERNPGRPIDRADVPAAGGPGAPAAARNVKVVDTQRPATRQAPPAAAGGTPAGAPAPAGGPGSDRGRPDGRPGNQPGPVPAPNPAAGPERGRGDAARPAPPSPAAPGAAPAPERGRPEAGRPAAPPNATPAPERGRPEAGRPATPSNGAPGPERGRPDAGQPATPPNAAPAPDRGRQEAGRPPAPPNAAPGPERGRPEAGRAGPPPNGAAPPERGRPADAGSAPGPARDGRPATPPPSPGNGGAEVPKQAPAAAPNAGRPPPQAAPAAPREAPAAAPDERRRGPPESRPAPAGRPEPQGNAPAARPEPAPAQRAAPAPAPAPAAPPREAQRERQPPNGGPPQRAAPPQPAPPPAAAAPPAHPPAPAPAPRPAAAPPQAPAPNAAPPQRAPAAPAPAARTPEPPHPASQPPAARGGQAPGGPPPAQTKEERGPDANRGRGQDKKDKEKD